MLGPYAADRTRAIYNKLRILGEHAAIALTERWRYARNRQCDKALRKQRLSFGTVQYILQHLSLAGVMSSSNLLIMNFNKLQP